MYPSKTCDDYHKLRRYRPSLPFFSELCIKKIIVKENEKELNVYFKQMKR